MALHCQTFHILYWNSAAVAVVYIRRTCLIPSWNHPFRDQRWKVCPDPLCATAIAVSCHTSTGLWSTVSRI